MENEKSRTITKKMAKSSKYIINQRVSEVADMLIEGKSRNGIIQYGTKCWKVGERQIDKYIAKARDVIQQEITKDLGFDYAKSIKRYENLYSKAYEVKDYRLALAVNKELSTIQGLYKIQIEHSGNMEFISNIPD